MKKYLPLVLATLIAPSANAVIIVDDSFADNDRANTGALQAAFYGSSSGSGGIESNTGSVGLVSGSSGRQIHALFATQTLASVGDSLTATITFTTPNSISSGGDDLKIGLYDHLGRTGSTQLGQDTSYSSGTPNLDFSGLFGYNVELDVEAADPATDLDIRRSDPSTTGRLLATNTGTPSLGSGPDIGYVFASNTSYMFTLMIERTLGGLDITTTFLGNSHTESDAAPLSYDFGMLAMGASSDAFGTSSTAGEADNGIDITNFKLEFNPIPEPSAAALMLFGGMLTLRRRRK